MRRSFKYRLDPTKAQAAALATQVETLRRVYNDALRERTDAWDLWGQGTRNGDQVKRWQVRRNLAIAATDGPRYLAQVAMVAMRDTIKRVDVALGNFFRRVKAGQTPGYPRFRGQNRYDSIPFNNYADGCVLHSPVGKPIYGDLPDNCGHVGFRLSLFGAGRIRVKLHRPLKGKIKTVTVKRDGEKWYVVFSCDLGDVPVAPHPGPTVGVDLGLEHFLSTSNGEHVPNPRLLGAELPELRREQRAASRKYVRGRKAANQSRRWRKTQLRVAKLHVRVKNLRREHAYRTANDLTKKFGSIAVEALNVSNMVRGGRLARHILDVAWGGFLCVLKHKAEKAGVRVVAVDPRGTSQECSGCGAEVRKDLSDRQHDCPACGLSLQRDVNAARNILARAFPEHLPRTGEAGAKAGVTLPCPMSFNPVCRPLPRVTAPGRCAAKAANPDRTRNPLQLLIWPDLSDLAVTGDRQG